MKRVVIAGVGVVALAAVGAAVWPRTTRLEVTGIVATDAVLVGSELGGRIARMPVREGDAVRQGDLLAEIQPPELAAEAAFYTAAAAQARAQAGAAEADARFQEAQTAAAIAQAEASLASARAQEAASAAEAENTRLARERAEALRAKGTNSVSEYDTARTADTAGAARRQAAAGQSRAAQSALRAAEAGAEQVSSRRAAARAAAAQADAAEAQARKARVRLGYTQVRAPLPGIVDVRAARPGEVVTPGQTIVSLIDPDDLWVRADLEETVVDRIRLGDHVAVRLPSGDTRDGVVFYRAVDGDFATQRDVSRTKRDVRTFELRVRCDNRDRALAVGMTAEVTLTPARR